MKLLIADHDDPLAALLAKRRPAGDDEIVWLSDSELFSTATLAFERNGTAVRGAIGVEGRVDGRRIDLARLSGVLLRPTRNWWPGPDFDLQDQMFVYHETTAAWFALFAQLECPVANRYPLGWWLHDLNYPEAVRDELAASLGLETAEPEAAATAPTGNGGSRLEPRRCRPEEPSLYLAGRRLVPRRDGAASALGRAAERPAALARWQQRSGILLARLDFAPARPHRLLHVEVAPPLAGEEPEVVAALAAALEETWETGARREGRS